MFSCERCGKEVSIREKCEYCSRKICNHCVKASRKVTKANRIVICKDCWNNTTLRSQYRNASPLDFS
ncbi:MAG: hypothetical protein QXL16_01465 [Candidatus Micrarchaeaceae archaeon]